MELKDLMKKSGNVEHVEIFLDNEGRSKGCGVVEFTNMDDAARAIKEMDGKDFQGRTLRLREDIMDDETYKKQLQTLKDKSRQIKHEQQQMEQMRNHGPPPPSGGPGGGLAGMLQQQTGTQQLYAMLNNKNVDPVNSTVFVSNLDYEINWKTLKDTFRRAGTCLRCDIQEDKEGKSKGFGTVVFEFPFEALTAVVLFNGLLVGKREIAVRLDRGSPLCALLQHLGVDTSLMTQTHLIQMQSQATLSQIGIGAGGLSGYGALAGSGGSASGFGGLGALSSISQLLQQAGVSTGGTSGGMSSSAAYGGSQGLGSTGGMVSSNQYSSPQGGYQPPSSMDNGRVSGGRDYGRRDSRGGASSGGVKAVFVRNLPFVTTWQDLKDKFREAGHVIRADIKKDEKGKSRGCGVVEFDSHDDAQRAVSLMNGMRMEGREIEVRLDRM
jgi:RNA recognition motif-containing protein